MSALGMTDAEKRASEHYFGGCPECGNTDGYMNVGSEHWFVCDVHRIKWFIGSTPTSCCACAGVTRT